MLVVRIHLVSAINSSRDAEIGRMYIANNGERSALDPKLGDYDVAVCRRGSMAVPQPLDENGPKPTRAGKVTDYPRLAYNVWRLIARAVTSAFPEERTLKPGTTGVLGPEIMRGLQWLAADYKASASLPNEEQSPDVIAALDWIQAATDVEPGIR